MAVVDEEDADHGIDDQFEYGTRAEGSADDVESGEGGDDIERIPSGLQQAGMAMSGVACGSRLQTKNYEFAWSRGLSAGVQHPLCLGPQKASITEF